MKLFFALILLISGCSQKKPQFKPGDCLVLSIDSNRYTAAIVISNDFYTDHYEYGICFTNIKESQTPNFKEISNKKIFGRKIQSYKEPGYEIGLDLIYLPDSCVRNNRISLIGNINFEQYPARIGSQSFAKNYNDLIYLFHDGYEKRRTPPDLYTEIYKLEKLRPEEYFSIDSILGGH